MPAEPISGTRAIGGFRDLLGAIVAFAGPNLPGTLTVVALGALLDGFGIVMLLPVVETVFAQGDGEQTGLTADLTAWLTVHGIDTVLEQLAAMGAVFLLLVAIRSAVLLKRDVVLMEVSQGFTDHVRRDFFALLADAQWPVIKSYRKADLLNQMTTNIGRLGQTMSILSKGLVTLALGIACLAAGFVVSTALGIMLVAFTLAGLGSAVVWSRRSRALGSRLTRANRGIMHETTLFLDGLKAAKAARAEEELARRFAARIAESREVQVSFVRQQSRLRNAIQFIAALAALMVLLLGFAVFDLSGGELLVMAAIVMRLSPSLVTTFGGMQQIAHALPAFSSIREMEANLLAARELAQDNEKAAVSSFPQDAPLTLRNCQVVAPGGAVLIRAEAISIPSGSLVHIGGPSGAGKSTLVELIAGLQLPATGRVMRGDIALGESTRAAWQRHIAFAPQEPFLFDGTVRENLLWPQLDRAARIPDTVIRQALDQSHAAAIVDGLPEGLDEPLLDGGARLSGGERQRLCLARALLRPGNLLVLDEATSAMDPALERAVVSSLKADAARRTIIMVSHSQNARDLADIRIAVAGGVAEIVSFDHRSAAG
ncbi:ATP-binding cassette domain-containing protein [Aurantiacibacter spongiae]|uniref:ABC transporter ATP-binding protein n=1 Tax=Aurantiacibacter spongiae TaxID=2488860 RepID=A0A3N5CQM8_9SPHN|nr:ABC transporter ATP-binding protein [Aurantiacibacter spongiae]RPF70917.1 ABC transporter ATP-binding protein [Aurantiacibacter spongiae]